MKKIGINISNLIKDHVLDALTDPKELEDLKERLLEIVPDYYADDADDIINEAFVLALNSGYDIGFETALSLVQGKTIVNIEVDKS